MAKACPSGSAQGRQVWQQAAGRSRGRAGRQAAPGARDCGSPPGVRAEQAEVTLFLGHVADVLDGCPHARQPAKLCGAACLLVWV